MKRGEMRDENTITLSSPALFFPPGLFSHFSSLDRGLSSSLIAVS